MNKQIRVTLKLTGVALAVGQAFAPYAYAQEAAPQQVVVTGIRASARSSVAIKRDTMEVVDSITAEDIGKLPDPNVGETLTRVPGVQAYRFGGEASAPFGGFGSGVTIRGLGYTAMQTNGRSYFSAGSREFNVEGAVPGMVAGIDVYKNPSAEHIEGGIGGLINVRTRNPSDFKGLTVSLGATAKYNDLAKEATPELTGLVANKWDLGGGSRIGVMAAATYQKSTVRNDNNPAGGRGPNFRRAVRGDSQEYADLAAKNTSDSPFQPMAAYVGRSDINYLANVGTNSVFGPDLTGLSAAQASNVMVGSMVNTNVFSETIMRERKGVNLAADYRVDNTLRFYAGADYYYFIYHQNYRGLNSTDGNNVQNLKTTPFNYTESLANRNLNGGTNDTLASQRLLSGTFLNSTVTTIGGDEHTPWTTMIGVVGVDWSPTNRLSLKGDVNYISSDKKSDNRSVGMSSANGLLWSTDRVADGAPHYLNFTGPSLSDPKNFVFNSYGNGQNYHNEDSGYAIALSGAYTLDDGLFSKLRFGARQAYQHDTFTNFGYGRDLTTDGKRLTANQSNGISAATLAGNLEQAPSNFMNGAAGYSGGYLVYVPDALLGNQVSAAFPTANIPVSPYAENLAARQIFGEHDAAAYLVGDFSALDERIKGNVGVRLVHTSTQAMARTTDPRTGALVDVARTNSYYNVLPTFNMTYEFKPDTLVRVGLGRGMTRPGLGDLNPVVNYNTTFGTGSIGNTALKPLVADSYDLSLEHYFNKTNYAAFALFDKEISDFPNAINSCETIDVLPAYDPKVTGNDNGCSNGQYAMRKSVNSEKGYARGFEVSGQMFFDSSYGILNNFGVSGSYSYAKTSNPINLGTLTAPQIVDTQQPFQSKNNYTLTGMYENDKLSARLAYTWRSESILFGVDTGGPIWARYIKSYGLLDGSVSYEIAKNTTLQFSAVNILNKAANRALGEPGPNAIPIEYQHFDNGRTFNLGLRYKFGG